MMKLYIDGSNGVVHRAKRLFSKFCGLALIIFGLNSCSEDLDFRNEIDNSLPEGFIQIELTSGSFQEIKTRAGEYDSEVNEDIVDYNSGTYALFYNVSETSTPTTLIAAKQITSNMVSVSGDVTNLTIELPVAVRSIPNFKVVMVTCVSNINQSPFTEGSNYSALQSDIVSSLVKHPAGTSGSYNKSYEMIGEATGTSGSYKIQLQRIAAKVSMGLASGFSCPASFSIESYTMYNSPQYGNRVAPIDNARKFNTTGTYQNIEVTNTNSKGEFFNYTYPVETLGKTTPIPTDNKKAYFILKASFDEDICYYRVDLKDAGGNYLNIESNHWYEVEIQSVCRKGYPSAVEAAARYMGQEEEDWNKEPSLRAVVHDHAAQVLSMTSDGSRELGVTRAITMTKTVSEPGGTDIFNNAPFTVKIYSPLDSDYDKDIDVNVIEGDDWVEVIRSGSNAPVEIGDSEELSGNQSDHADNPGKRYRYTLKFKENAKIFNDKSAIVRVTWCGLSRDIDVTYNADFTPETACSVTLNYKTIGSTSAVKTSQENYWNFIKNTVKGVDGESMSEGRLRNEGFHFPMPYGDGNQWTYDYDIDFTASKPDDNSITLHNVTISTTGDTFFRYGRTQATQNLVWNYNASTFTGNLKLKNPASNDFTYATGTLTFTLHYSDESTRTISVALYHSGFFDEYDSTTYYYEVINCGGYYWLDRNVGASSNKMFVDYDGTSAGNSGATGGYFKIANNGDYNDATKTDPTVLTSMCPKGYTIPNSTDWDHLRLSKNFLTTDVTEDGQHIAATYYDTNNKKMGNCYFPKSRFYNQSSPLDDDVQSTDTPNSGNSAGGYYWTSSVASGLEKAEIGCWLKAVNFIGSSNTYIFGSIKNHMMNVRCIANVSHKTETKNTIEFNVKGATHVYLYTVDDDLNKSGLFEFPGKAIGSSSAVAGLNYNSDDSYLHFSYTSSVPADQLFVFFVYKDDNTGKITILSNNGVNTVRGAEGWEVYNNYNYFFYPSSGSTDHSNPNLESTRIFEVGGKEKKYLFPKNKSIKIIWPQMTNNTNLYRIYLWNGGTEFAGGFPGGKNDKDPYTYDDYEGNAYEYTFTSPMDMDSFKVIFSVDDKSHQTQNIDIKEKATYVKSINTGGDPIEVIMAKDLPWKN